MSLDNRSKLKLLVIVLLSLAIVTAGCSKPEVKSVKMHWGKVNSSVTQIISNVYVTDPLPFSIPLSGVNVKLYMNGIEMGVGHSIGKTSISPPGGNITLSIDLINKRLVDWWVTHIKNGEKTTIKVVSNLEFNLFGFKFSVPVTRISTFTTSILSVKPKGTYVSVNGLNLGEVSNINLRWGDVTPSTTQIILSAKVKNLINEPIEVKYLSYEIYMNGIKMGSGKVFKNKEIGPKSESTVQFTMYINNSKIPQWWVTHIRNGEKTNVNVKMNLGLEVYGREVVVPVGYSYTFTTNFLSQSPVG